MDEKINSLRDGTADLFQIEQSKSTPPGVQLELTTDAEKRVEQIRDEILKAMDRLEQIESEG